MNSLRGGECEFKSESNPRESETNKLEQNEQQLPKSETNPEEEFSFQREQVIRGTLCDLLEQLIEFQRRRESGEICRVTLSGENIEVSSKDKCSESDSRIPY